MFSKCIASLPPHILSSIFSLNENDLRQLRLVNREFYTAATSVVTSLRPTKGDALIPKFSGLKSIDFTALPADAWPEVSLGYLKNAKGITSLKFGSSSFITATDGATIATLTSLRSIEVHDIKMANSALHCWSNLSALTSISLLGCRDLTENGLAVLGTLKNLEIVELGSCQGVTDKVLATLSTLPLLNKLDISSCDNFTEEGLAALSAAPCLRTVLLAACWHVDDEMLCTLCRSLPNLECLSLFEAGEGASDTGLGYLTALTRLTGLDLGYSCWAHTSGGLERVIPSFPGLQMLNIGGTDGACNDVLRAVGSHLTALTMLDISECQRVTVNGIKELRNLPKLQEMHLGWNMRLKSSALRNLPSSLTHLDLSYCAELSLNPLEPGSLPNVEHVQVRRCALLDDAGLACLAAAAPNLLHVDLSYCSNISSYGLKCLSSLTQLSSVVISGCHRAVTVLGLGNLAALPALLTLEACNNPRLDDGCMQAVSFVRQLKHLSLRGCPRISDHGVLALSRIAKLETLKIDGRNVTQAAIEKLQARLPRLRRVQMTSRDPARRTMEMYDSLGVPVYQNNNIPY